MNKPLREGDWFAVPLAGAGYVLGLVARAPRRGGVLFGYLFGPIRDEVPRFEELPAHTPSDAVWICRFRNDALVSGRWPILGSSSEWDRTLWPMPEFHTPDLQRVLGESRVMRYSEDAPSQIVDWREIPSEEERDYPADDGELHPSHVEYRLGVMYGVPHPDDEVAMSASPEGLAVFLSCPPDAVKRARPALLDLGFNEVEVVEERATEVSLMAFMEGSVSELRASVEELERRVDDLARRLGGSYDAREWALG